MSSLNIGLSTTIGYRPQPHRKLLNLPNPHLFRAVTCRSLVLAGLASCIFLCAISRTASAQPDGAAGQLGQQLTGKDVEQSIARGITYLFKNQSKQTGGWDEYFSQNCGASALCTLALLNSGVSPAHPQLVKALEYLRGFEPEKTYSVALQTMVFCAANPNEDMVRIRQNAQWLISTQLPNGAWTYPAGIPAGGGDPSNTQFALLALAEAQRVGVPVPQEVYLKSMNYWMSIQSQDGSWQYTAGEPSSGSMTCAGISSLIITMGQLGKPQSSIRRDKILCCGQTNIDDDRIVAGFNWLAKNFRVSKNPGNSSFWQLYFLYGLERVGRMTGQRFIGQYDWYREGAAQLISQQDRLQGFFTSRSGSEASVHINTALALLFLSKGKRQIVISRLEHAEPENWNLHQFAMQNITSHVEQVWKRDLTWQTINFQRATLADLLETPVLFISGRDAIKFSAEQKQLLKQYVEQGGFIFAEACNGDGCKGTAFDESFKALVEELFGQSLIKLPPTHPIWFAEAAVDPESLPKDFWLYGINACCRTSIVYSPIPLSCRWELAVPYGTAPEHPGSVQAELDSMVKIGLNVLAYATGRRLKDKLDRPQIIRPDSPVASSANRMLRIPKLQHAGGADDAPRTIPNLLQWMRNEQPLDLINDSVLIPVKLEELEKYPTVFIHGRGKFSFTDDERKALRTYLQRGGFLFGDAICASNAFADSFRKEMSLILPENSLEPIADNHPLLTEQFDGFDIRQVTLLDSLNRAGDGGLDTQKSTIAPVLEAITLDERICVVFSPFDLSCALESQQSLQCKGYLREDAAKIGINIILFSLRQ